MQLHHQHWQSEAATNKTAEIGDAFPTAPFAFVDTDTGARGKPTASTDCGEEYRETLFTITTTSPYRRDIGPNNRRFPFSPRIVDADSHPFRLGA